jgi:hypothetical protein
MDQRARRCRCCARELPVPGRRAHLSSGEGRADAVLDGVPELVHAEGRLGA